MSQLEGVLLVSSGQRGCWTSRVHSTAPHRELSGPEGQQCGERPAPGPGQLGKDKQGAQGRQHVRKAIRSAPPSVQGWGLLGRAAGRGGEGRAGQQGREGRGGEGRAGQ